MLLDRRRTCEMLLRLLVPHDRLIQVTCDERVWREYLLEFNVLDLGGVDFSQLLPSDI